MEFAMQRLIPTYRPQAQSRKHRNRVRLAVLGVFEKLEARCLLATFTADPQWGDAVDLTPLGDGVVDTVLWLPGNQVSLRGAIQEANALAGADTIQLLSGTYLFSRTGTNEDAASTGDLDITDTLTIAGDRIFGATIDANGIDRAFHVHSGTTLLLSRVTVIDGNADQGAGSHDGGAVLNDGGTTTIIYSTLDGNTADQGGGAANAGGTLRLINSTVSGNEADADGGGVHASSGTVYVTNSTVSGNSAGDDGGGLAAAGGTVHLENSTIAENSATGSGGGVERSGGTVDLSNMLVADNSAGSDNDLSGSFTTLGYNLIGDIGSASGLTNGLNNDQVGSTVSPIDPMLGPLQDNGGHTWAHALLDDSPAIDAGSSSLFEGLSAQLSVAINATTTTVTISEQQILPTTTYYHIQIDNEVMRVRAATGGTLTVVRGINGTTPAAHSASATVTLLAAQRGERRVTDGNDAGTTATQDIGAFEFGTFFTNDTTDQTDASTLGDGTVDTDTFTSGDQVGLRAAIQELNALADDGPMEGIIEISHSTGTFPLTIGGSNEDDTETGDLDTYGNLTINGRGEVFTIVGDEMMGMGVGDRIFHVQPTSRLVLYGMTVTYGDASSENGGGILNEEGTLEIADSGIGSGPAFQHFRNSADLNGGGIYNTASSTGSGGILLIEFSEVFDNLATNGGGIYSASGSVTIRDSAIYHNQVTGDGGGIYIASGTATITGSTISNGPDGGNIAWYKGGGLFAGEDATVILSSTAVEANEAGTSGAGIHNEGAMTIDDGSAVDENVSGSANGVGIYNSGTLDIEDSSVSGNTNSAGGIGGGIYNNGGSVSLTDSEMYGNLMVSSDVAGIYNLLGDVSLVRTTMEHNRAQNAIGAIHNEYGYVSLLDSTLDENWDDFIVGGILNEVGILEIERSTLSENSAQVPDVSAIRSGGIVVLDGPETTGGVHLATLSDSASSSDTTLEVADATAFTKLSLPRYIAVHNGWGGDLEYMRVTAASVNPSGPDTLTVVRGISSTAIAHDSGDQVDLLGGDLSILNSTFSGNWTVGDEWQPSYGGAIHIAGTRPVLEGYVPTSIRHSTFSENIATDGGGIANFAGGGTIHIKNTIVANSLDSDPIDFGDDPIPDVYGSFTSLGYNLIEDVGSASGFGATGDQTSIDPDLGSLQDNGGPTETHALNPSSPAIDAGDNTGAPATDQRGMDRIENLVVDIGAYEYAGESLLGAIDAPSHGPAASLALGVADELLGEALRQWEHSQGQLRIDVRLETASLRGRQLAAGEVLEFDAAGRPVQARVVLDMDAAGLAWHTSRFSQPQAGQYDLLTVMLHEVGHILGLSHTTEGHHNSLMDATLSPGDRLLPSQHQGFVVDELLGDLGSITLHAPADIWVGFLPLFPDEQLSFVPGWTTGETQVAAVRQTRSGPRHLDADWAAAVDRLLEDDEFRHDKEQGLEDQDAETDDQDESDGSKVESPRPSNSSQ
jgi:fibronectin-binding autotransporter adhesin